MEFVQFVGNYELPQDQSVSAAVEAFLVPDTGILLPASAVHKV